MPTRIEIELTSTSPDGSWTWRAAGAREPRGVLDGSLLPQGASVGDQLRVETEQDLDGIHVLAVVPAKEKGGRADLLELLPSEDRFEPVIQQRAQGGRDDDRARRGPRRDRGDRPGGDRRDRPDRRRDGGPGDRLDRGDRDRAARGDRSDRGDRRDGERREPRRSRPHFTPPPEVPQRPKPKRLRPGKEHRTEVLASISEEQRPVAELALQGLAAVRQRLREDNTRLQAEGKPQMPEAAVMKMAEDLLPRLRVADWLDRADAAKRQMEHLDLRDLRSVVAASDDPLVARDEATRTLAGELKGALVVKQEEELTLWLSDVEAALDVGRVVRALRLSSQPPKAGVPFPPALAARLGEATTAALQPTDAPDRWIAVLEAAAFSPIRSHVVPTTAPEQASDDLRATVTRLGPLLPQVAALFGIEVAANAHVPKPLRPTPRKQPAKQQAAKQQAAKPGRADRPAADRPSATDEPTPVAAAAPDVPTTTEPAQPEPAPPTPTAEGTPIDSAAAAPTAEAAGAATETPPAATEHAPPENAPSAPDPPTAAADTPPEVAPSELDATPANEAAPPPVPPADDAPSDAAAPAPAVEDAVPVPETAPTAPVEVAEDATPEDAPREPDTADDATER